jgi:hypothetical protein
MNSQTVADWVQIVTGAALLVGLALVVWELSQSRDVATAQLTSDGSDHNQQHFIARMGENSAAALAKACVDPDSLSDEELVVLDAYFSSIASVSLRAYAITERSGLYEGRWVEIMRHSFYLILRSVPGRTWWARERQFYPTEFTNAVDAVSESSPPRLRCWIKGWRDRIEQASTP